MSVSGSQTAPTQVDPAPQRVLRLLTCGGADDGKSSLVQRLLHELEANPEAPLSSLDADSRRWGELGSGVELAPPQEGLRAVEMSCRHFATPRRKFIVADLPGHEQSTRYRVMAASTAQVAMLLVDARRGLLAPARRHSHLLRLMGVRRVLLLVNKMDLVGWDEAVFQRIAADYRDVADRIGLTVAQSIPVSALHGDNLLRPRRSMAWYQGPTLIEALEGEPLDGGLTPRMPVQRAVQPHAESRGDAGLIVAGTVEPGDPICAAAAPTALAALADRFECSLVCTAEEALLPGRSYLLKIGTRSVGAQLTELHHRLDLETGQPLGAQSLGLNEIGAGTLVLDQMLAFDPDEPSRASRGFTLLDRLSQSCMAAGLLHRALPAARNLHPQALSVDRAARRQLMRHGSALVWLTGLSGAGKSTIANLLEQRLHAQAHHTYLLDGDHVRRGLCKDLGFSPADRVENIRRLAEVGRLMVDAGLIVLVAAISPFRADRQQARELLGSGCFLEIHVDVPLAVAEARDPKGLYRKARRGELPHFTGIDSPYEAPDQPELRIDSSLTSAQAAARQIHELLQQRGII